MDNSNFDRFRADHLFLLVGKNPLPNFVAARLLAAEKGAVWLLYSDDPQPGTKRAAQAIELLLRKYDPDLSIRLEPISSSNNLRIENRMREILDGAGLEGSAGLNYTGGTKVMAVHVYRFLAGVWGKRGGRPVFSYLDPRQIALRIDGYGAQSPQIFPIRRDSALWQRVDIDLDDLAALHGYTRVEAADTGWADPGETPGLVELCAALARIHVSPPAFAQWRQWMREDQFQTLPDAAQYPLLKPVCEMFDRLCSGPGGRATPESVAAYLRPRDSNPSLASCAKWLIGTWLEAHCAICLLQVAGQAGVTHKDSNLEFRDQNEGLDKHELDAAAMVGYQFFGVSSIATESKAKAKDHFLVAYVRARQLGGDEARAGVVSLLDDPDFLEKEIRRAWDTEGQLRVFGRDDLRDLAGAFTRWFATANQ